MIISLPLLVRGENDDTALQTIRVKPRMRTLLALSLLIIILCIDGCGPRHSVQTFAQPASMRVTLLPVPDLALEKSEVIQVERESIPTVFKLLTPAKPIKGGVNKSVSPLLAKCDIHACDGSSYTVYVRWMGHNPLAVSLDDSTYYWGGTTVRIDGGIALLQVLKPDIGALK